MTAERLATAIETALAGETLVRRAAELGAHIQAEGGIARAAEIVRSVESRLPTIRES